MPPKIQDWLADLACNEKIGEELCANIAFLLCGFDKAQINEVTRRVGCVLGGSIEQGRRRVVAKGASWASRFTARLEQVCCRLVTCKAVIKTTSATELMQVDCQVFLSTQLMQAALATCSKSRNIKLHQV